MADVINICLDSAKYPKCAGCPHNRPDQERSGESVCWLDQDLKGEERIKYLVRLLKETGDFQSFLNAMNAMRVKK